MLTCSWVDKAPEQLSMCPGTHEKYPHPFRAQKPRAPEKRSSPIGDNAALHQRSSPGGLLGEPLRNLKTVPSLPT